MAESPQPDTDTPPAVLLTPGERLGWIFRDRNRFRRRFGEPPPVPPAPPVKLISRAGAAKRKLGQRLVIAGLLGSLSVLVTGCCGAVNRFFDDGGAALNALAVLALAGAAAGMAGVWAHYAGLQSSVEAVETERRAWYDAARADWGHRKAAFDRDEHQRVEQLPEWTAAMPDHGSRRVDVVGGSTWGWEALLTVFGASLLATRGAMILVDFSGAAVSRELLRLAGDNGISVDLLLLPDDLAECDLLAGLDSRQLVDTVVESMHAYTDASSRADRALDDRILTTVCDALGADLSLARLAAALRVLMGEPGEASALTPQEHRHIDDDLFGDEFRRQSHARLRRLEAYLHPLVTLGTRRRVREPAALTCLAVGTGGRDGRGELLDDLIVGWLFRRVVAGTAGPGSLVIAATDEMPRRDIERLSDLCERHDVRLVLLFRQLRDAPVGSIGGGVVGFMRLADYDEAREAADLIGREQRFVLTQLTSTLSGDETHALADAWGRSEAGAGCDAGDGSDARDGCDARGDAESRDWSVTHDWSVTRDWGQTRRVAASLNWSDAESRQRVHEYAVEPWTLQDLPDYALLMVRWQPTGSMLVPVECNPDLVSLPRLTMDPPPPPAVPTQAAPYADPPTSQRPGRARRQDEDVPPEVPRS